jgi:hypothetical protein
VHVVQLHIDVQAHEIPCGAASVFKGVNGIQDHSLLLAPWHGPNPVSQRA